MFSTKPILFEKLGEKLIRVECYLLGTGINRNGSNITKEAVMKANKKGLKHLPVVAHLMQDESGKYFVGSHDVSIEFSPQMKMEPLTVPVGCVCGDSKFEFIELVEPSTGETREYLKVDFILWNHMTPVMEAAFSRDVYFNHSIEIDIVEGDWDSTNNFRIDEFEYDKACLLGLSDDKSSEKHSEPAFELAQVYPAKFSFDDNGFKQMFNLLLEEVSKVENDVSSNEPINSPPAPSNEDFDINLNNKETEDDKPMEFSKNVIEAVKSSIQSKAKYRKGSTGKSYSKYEVVEVKENEVSFIDREDAFRGYTTTYTATELEDKTIAVVVDYDNKKEGSLVVGEKIEETFSIENEINTFSTDEREFALAKRKDEEVNDLFEKLEASEKSLKTTKSELSKCKSQISALVKEKTEYELNAKKNTIDSLIAAYSKSIEKFGDFEEYKARLDYSKPVEVVENELSAILGKYTFAKTKNKLGGYEGITAGKFSNQNFEADPIRARYGDAFDQTNKI